MRAGREVVAVGDGTWIGRGNHWNRTGKGKKEEVSFTLTVDKKAEMNLFKKKKLQEEPAEKEKEPEPIDYNNLPLDTAPVANFKKKFAQDLYEPWMDEGRKKSVSIDSSTPKKYPEIKNRSKFAFADDYVQQPSPSLASLSDDQRKKEEAEREKIAQQQAEIEKEKAKITPQPTLEEWGPIDKKSNKKHQVVRLQGVGSSLLYPRATSALYDLDEEDRQIELEEFYAWVTNGSEHDLHTAMIERILFRNRQLERRRRPNPRERRH